MSEEYTKEEPKSEVLKQRCESIAKKMRGFDGNEKCFYMGDVVDAIHIENLCKALDIAEKENADLKRRLKLIAVHVLSKSADEANKGYIYEIATGGVELKDEESEGLIKENQRLKKEIKSYISLLKLLEMIMEAKASGNDSLAESIMKEVEQALKEK